MKNPQIKICEMLWKEHEPQLRKICRIKLRSRPDEIDDVMSETSLALCRQIEKYGIPKKPKQWLYAAFNNILNLKYREIYRHSNNLPLSETRELELPFKNDEIEDKIEEIYNNELCGKLQNFLTEDEYIIVKFIYFEQLKMKEIAEIIGSTEAAVKQKHYRICNKIRKAAKKFEKNY